MQHGTADMLKGEVFYVCYECPSIFFRKIILLMQERFKIYAYQLNQLGLSKKLQGIITWSPTFRGSATPKKTVKMALFHGFTLSANYSQEVADNSLQTNK